MVLRVLTTAVKMWQRWRRQHPRARHTPMIIPVVVYHGDRPWRAPRDMLDLYALSPAMRAGLGAHLISCRLVIDDLCATADEELRARRMSAYAKLCLFAMARGAAEDFLDRLVGDWHAELRAVLVAESRDRAVLFLRYTLHVNPHADPDTLRERLSPVAGEDAEEVIMSAAEKLIQQGIEKGIEKERRALLLQFLEQRFGALPAAITARVSAADVGMLKRWVDRAFEARSLDEVFTER